MTTATTGAKRAPKGPSLSYAEVLDIISDAMRRFKPPKAPKPPVSVLHLILTDGRLGVSVPLFGKRGEGHRVVLDADDWQRLCLTHGDRWTLREFAKGYRYVVCLGKHDGMPMARLVAHAEAGESVAFLDGDRQNLARGNLVKLTHEEAFTRAQGRSATRRKGAAA